MKRSLRITIIITIAIIISTMGLIAYLLINKWNGTDIKDSDVLSASVSFLSPIIGLLSAYFIFNLGKKQDKNDEIEYNLNMLYSLLKHTIVETESLCASIFIYMLNSNNMDINFPYDLIHVDEGCKFIGPECNRIDLSDFKEEVHNLILNANLQALIYNDEWYKHLKGVEDVKNRQVIINWIHILRGNNISSYTLVTLRDRVISITESINRYETDIKFNDTYDICVDTLQAFKNGGMKFSVGIDSNGKYYNLSSEDFMCSEEIIEMNA